MQEKTALLRHDGHWFKPLGTTPTTHILKPQIGKIDTSTGAIDLSNSVENEFYCLKLLAAFGLATTEAEIATAQHCLGILTRRRRRQPVPATLAVASPISEHQGREGLPIAASASVSLSRTRPLQKFDRVPLRVSKDRPAAPCRGPRFGKDYGFASSCSSPGGLEIGNGKADSRALGRFARGCGRIDLDHGPPDFATHVPGAGAVLLRLEAETHATIEFGKPFGILRAQDNQIEKYFRHRLVDLREVLGSRLRRA